MHVLKLMCMETRTADFFLGGPYTNHGSWCGGLAQIMSC